MPRKNQDHPVQIPQTASEIVCPQCMRHSPAFDIVGRAGNCRAHRFSGMDRRQSFAQCEIRGAAR